MQRVYHERGRKIRSHCLEWHRKEAQDVRRELQYLLALEFLAIAEGSDVKAARKAYEHALAARFKTSVMPASCHEIPVEDVIDLLKSVRDSVDPNRWVDMEDIAVE